MKSNMSGITSLVLVLVAFSSLLSMFALTRIDNIVHSDLYSYGLRFSYEWAMPYWTMTTLVFIMGWVNIFMAIIFQFYVLLHGRKEAEVIPPMEALKPETTYQPPIEESATVVEEKREEAEMAVASLQEETQRPIEEIAAQEYIETEQSGEVEGQREQEAEWRETVETEPTPEERFEEPQEQVDVQRQEETSHAEEEEREQEEMWRETLPPEPEIEAETTESEETATQTPVSTEEHETPTEETQQQEAELTEHYPT